MAETLIPIVLLILTGVLLKKIKFISDSTVNGMKKIVSNIFLPVVVFNAMATAKFSRDSIFLFSISMFALVASFGIGFLVKKLWKKDCKDYIPYIITTFEGGMIGYALSEVLIGEKLYYFATLDLAGAVFSFTIWITLLDRLSKRNDKEHTETKKENIFISMIKTPTLDAAILGVIFALTGLIDKITGSAAAATYSRVVDLFSTPMTPIILICLGFSIKFTKESLRDAVVLIVQRIVVLAAVVALAIFVLGRFITFDKELTAAIIMFFCLPPSFLLTVYVKGKKSEEMLSCVMSIYIILTLGTFSGLLAWLR